MPDYIGHRNATDEPQRKPIRILVVDDDRHVGDMIRDNFAGEGFMVDLCSNYAEVFNIDLSKYRLVLLDIAAADENGINFIDQIKQIHTLGDVSIIAFSPRMTPETIINALNAGADDYLIKPFSIRELRARVQSVLRHR